VRYLPQYFSPLTELQICFLMKVTLQTKPFLLVASLVAVLAPACRDIQVDSPNPLARQFDNQVYLEWNNLFLEVDRNARGYRPGPAPRALGYLGLSAYESVVAGMPGYNSMENLLPGLEIPDADANQDYYWPACVNESYAFLMKRFFFHMENEYPQVFAKIEQKRKQLHAEFADQTTAEILERSEQYGRDVASAVYEWERTDLVGHNAFLDPQPISYSPPQGPGRWQPTFPDYGAAVYPQWGQVRTFAINETDKLARPPIPYSDKPTSLYYTQGMETFNTVNLIKNPPVDQQAYAYDQRWRAFFWSDDILNLTFSPPARLIAIANQVVDREELNLEKSAAFYAQMGLALSDCGVAIWHSKYHYNVQRPVEYIRMVIAQQYPEAATWQTILTNTNNGTEGITPSFPAYPSGHSGFGGAGAKILSAWFEYTAEHPGTYTFTDLCHKDRWEFIGTPRTFNSFKELGDEDAYSRIPLGVHWRMDCDEGVRMGEVCAQRVLDLPWKKNQ
jgi:membrane-associated phospholipid phosphatase